ncbi:MAG: hypothetical protein ACFE9C_18700 [Candidatus Hodarchaeota archaeon]
MVVVYGKIRDEDHIKKAVDKNIKCPKCNKEIKIGIELEVFNKLNSLKNVYFPHIHLHGKPLHALLCYINSELKLRNVGIIESIEISRDSKTLMQFLEKWTNPY